MREVKTYGEKQGATLKVHYKERFENALKAMKDGRIEIIVRRLYRKRSTPQNAFYWCVIVEIARQCLTEATGESHTKEQAHEELKRNCNYKEVASRTTGEIMKVGSTTTQHTTVEAMEYYTRCRQWLFDWFEADCPDPGEQTTLNFDR